MKPKNLPHIQVSQISRIPLHGQRDEVSHLSQMTNNHPHRLISTMGTGKTIHKIHRDMLPFPLGNRKRVQKTTGSLIFSLNLLTRQTMSHKHRDISLYALPPEGHLQIMIHLYTTRVNSKMGPVGLLKNFSPDLKIIGNTELTLKLQTTIRTNRPL